MLRILAIILTGILTSFYFFPFEFTFLPGANTKMIMAGLGLVILVVNMARGQRSTIDKNFFQLTLCAIIVSIAGLTSIILNITYDYVKPEFIVPAMAIKNCVGGILGFGASLVGGAFLQFVQDNGNVLFGIKAYGQQFMSTIAVIILIGAVVFGKFVVEKQKRIS